MPLAAVALAHPPCPMVSRRCSAAYTPLEQLCQLLTSRTARRFPLFGPLPRQAKTPIVGVWSRACGTALKAAVTAVAWMGFSSAPPAGTCCSSYAQRRNVPNLIRNLRLAWTLLRRLRPWVIVTTGAGVAVPFAWVGRLLGAKVVYIESITRIDAPPLSCRLIRPVAARNYVRWPELAQVLPSARYSGSVLGRA